MSELVKETHEIEALKSGLHLTLGLGDETYGIEILKVHEIIGLMPITKVPRLPEYVRGVINLRGKVVPVIDLRLKFRMEQQEDTERTCIIVVQAGERSQNLIMGVLVDDVAEVIEIKQEQVEPAPALSGTESKSYINSMAKVGEQVVMLLDIDEILAGSELDSICQQKSNQ